jgi:molecular chaperone Hsp33
MSSSSLTRCLARRAADKEPALRLFVAETTELCRTACALHHLSPLATMAFARALTGGILLGALAKSERNINLQIAGDGPIGTIFVDADPKGTVRGYVSKNPALQPKAGARPLVGYAFGDKGYVNVLRADAANNYFRGTVALKSGEIDEDIGEYLASSEQVESVLSIDAVLDGRGQIARAGGVLLQALPSAGESLSLHAERQRLPAGVLYEALANGGDAWPEAIARAFLLELSVLEERAIGWACQCSENRVMAALLATGIDELNDILAKEGKAEIRCDFCRKEYLFDREQLVKLRDLAVSAALSHPDKADHGDN